MSILKIIIKTLIILSYAGLIKAQDLSKFYNRFQVESDYSLKDWVIDLGSEEPFGVPVSKSIDFTPDMNVLEDTVNSSNFKDIAFPKNYDFNKDYLKISLYEEKNNDVGSYTISVTDGRKNTRKPVTIFIPTDSIDQTIKRIALLDLTLNDSITVALDSILPSKLKAFSFRGNSCSLQLPSLYSFKDLNALCLNESCSENSKLIEEALNMPKLVYLVLHLSPSLTDMPFYVSENTQAYNYNKNVQKSISAYRYLKYLYINSLMIQPEWKKLKKLKHLHLMGGEKQLSIFSKVSLPKTLNYIFRKMPWTYKVLQSFNMPIKQHKKLKSLSLDDIYLPSRFNFSSFRKLEALYLNKVSYQDSSMNISEGLEKCEKLRSLVLALPTIHSWEKTLFTSLNKNINKIANLEQLEALCLNLGDRIKDDAFSKLANKEMEKTLDQLDYIKYLEIRYHSPNPFGIQDFRGSFDQLEYLNLVYYKHNDFPDIFKKSPKLEHLKFSRFSRYSDNIIEEIGEFPNLKTLTVGKYCFTKEQRKLLLEKYGDKLKIYFL